MFDVILIFIAIFVVMTLIVLFIDKLGDFVDTHFHSEHHNQYDYEEDAEKLVD